MKLLKNILPESIIERMQSGQKFVADSHQHVVILFSGEATIALSMLTTLPRAHDCHRAFAWLSRPAVCAPCVTSAPPADIVGFTTLSSNLPTAEVSRRPRGRRSRAGSPSSLHAFSAAAPRDTGEQLASLARVWAQGWHALCAPPHRCS